MKRKITAMIMAVIMVFTVYMIPADTATAYSSTDTKWTDGVEGGAIYFDEATGTITDCDSSVKSANIPEKINGVGVKSIRDLAFENCKSLTSITIPSSVTSIGYRAFDGCESLTSIAIPSSVTNIGDYAFIWCYSLTSITVDGSNKNYSSKDGVLYNKSQTTLIKHPIGNARKSFTIPNSVKSIGDYAFSLCENLTSITIPDSVTSIGKEAFSCRKLSSITIPSSVTSIGDGAFDGCESLTSITIPSSVTNIGDYAFGSCYSLTSITVDGSNINYSSKDGVLYNKSQTALIQHPIGNARKSFTIPNSVKSIGDYAFNDCRCLTIITIPNSVTSIGNKAFSYCESLTSITIPNRVTSIREYAFSGCSSLTSITIPNSVTSIGYMAFDGCESLTSIAIPSSVTSIGGMAFAYCRSLTSITIPNSVTSIGDGAFFNCYKLTIYGYAGSYAETYAKNDGIPFVDINANRVSGNITVKYNPVMEDKYENSVTEYYSDDFFSYDNSKYHKDLALFSLVVTMASGSKWTKSSDRSNRNGHIKELFGKLKFSNLYFKKYTTTLDNADDTVAYAFAKKTIDGKNVMAVAIRSSNYGGEWASNARVTGGTTNEHKGFSSAAQGVYTDLKTYAANNDIDKIWICGYSRGGAVAGILGNKVAKNKIVAPENLYCYTFEAPMSTLSGESTRGIYNLISTSDLIPLVPLVQWGFTRYGNNVYINSSKHSLLSYRKGVFKARSEFSELTGNTLRSNSAQVNHAITGVFAILIPRLSDYSNKQDTVSKVLKLLGSESSFISGKKDQNWFNALMESIGCNIKLYSFSGNVQAIPIMQQHWGEATYAWLKHGETKATNKYKLISFAAGALTNARALSSSSDANAERIESNGINNNYNVCIYDSNDNLVAEITEGDYYTFIENNPDISLDVIEGLNGELQILIPEDDTYRFEVEAKDDIAIDYQLQEMENENELTKTIQYNGIELNDNDTLTGTSEEGIGIEADTYNPVVNNSDEVMPDVVAQGEDLNAVNVSVESEGDGIATGDGSYPDGSKVTLTAIPFENAAFIGWYSGDTLISKEDHFSFYAAAGEDKEYKAKFTSDISRKTVTLSSTSYTYNGKTKTPAVTIDGLSKGKHCIAKFYNGCIMCDVLSYKKGAQ